MEKIGMAAGYHQEVYRPLDDFTRFGKPEPYRYPFIHFSILRGKSMKKDRDRKKMMGRKSEPKPTRGRPVENELPDLIPDTAENVARASMQGPPKKGKEWRYMKKGN